MVKKIIYITIWILTAAALIALFVFAREDYLTSPVKAVNVNIEREGSKGFVNEEQLLADIKNLHKNANIGTVNMTAIQKCLGKNPWVETSTSYIDLDGTLCINLKEYCPVTRVFDSEGRSVYITENSVVIPTDTLYTPHVLVFNGSFTLRNDSTSFALNDTLAEDKPLIEALRLYKAISSNDFMKSCIGQVYRDRKGNYDIVVKGIDAQIIIGDTCHIDDKLHRAEIFIKQKAESAELKDIKIINFKYKNQVVCTKR